MDEQLPSDLADLLAGRLLTDFKLSIERAGDGWHLHLIDHGTGTVMAGTGKTVAETWVRLTDRTDD